MEQRMNLDRSTAAGSDTSGSRAARRGRLPTGLTRDEFPLDIADELDVQIGQAAPRPVVRSRVPDRRGRRPFVSGRPIRCALEGTLFDSFRHAGR
jgi:hypothetical protein